MNTATPLAMIAVIAMTMTISISVTPLCGFLGCLKSIGRVAHSVAVKLDGRVGRPGHRDGDKECLGAGNGAGPGAEPLLRNIHGGAVRTEARHCGASDVGDARSHGETVVVIYVVERVGRAGTRFRSVRRGGFGTHRFDGGCC